jgi:hypothetical protein
MNGSYLYPPYREFGPQPYSGPKRLGAIREMRAPFDRIIVEPLSFEACLFAFPIPVQTSLEWSTVIDSSVQPRMSAELPVLIWTS